MKLVLLSGGSGKRLWPLSNDVRSKQFLKMLRNPDGELESMVQRIARQLKANQLLDKVFISTTNAQIDMLQSQVGADVPLIIEPESRDTFPAITLATVYLYSKLGADSDEVISVMPVDSFVDDAFFLKIKQLEKVIRQSEADLALIGVVPTYASTKYGYIVPGDTCSPLKPGEAYRQVNYFKEKPTEAEAEQLLENQALWNCGIFSFRLGYVIDVLRQKGLPTTYDQFVEHFSSLPRISFDYEIAEKAKQIVVVPYDKSWKDLGTWNTITEEVDVNIVGNGYLAEGCTNTHIVNELDLPVVAVGVSNVIVAASPDGILVAEKAKSHLVKDIAKNLNQRPMYEERRWGWYHVFNHQVLPNKMEVLTKRLHVHTGKNLSYQYHNQRSEIWVIVNGEGEFILDGLIRAVAPGDVLEIPQGSKHGIKATEDLDIIEVQMGSKLEEGDIVRLCLSWEEMKQFIQH